MRTNRIGELVESKRLQYSNRPDFTSSKRVLKTKKSTEQFKPVITNETTGQSAFDQLEKEKLILPTISTGRKFTN